MGTYVYASISIGGTIRSVFAAKSLAIALVADGLAEDEDGARAFILDAVNGEQTLDLEDAERNGGSFNEIDDTIRKLDGLECSTSFTGSPGEWASGYKGVGPDGTIYDADGNDDQPTIPLASIEEALAAEDPNAAALAVAGLVLRARMAAGLDMEPLSAPEDVLEWLRTGLEYVRIGRDPNLDDNGIPCATTNEIAGLIAVMDGAGMKPGEHFNVDVDPQASRADDATWVQVWVRVPNPEEETANGEE